MCGIAGMLSLDGAPARDGEVRRMCAAMQHRGPDDEGFHVDRDVALGMRRLSIIDLETGQQPVGNEDGSVWVVLNGEVYNFRELRLALKARGHAFRTNSDTECVVHLYEEHGIRCLEGLRGMFAFALWDARRRVLLLARDRLGVKPLYYAVVGGRLVFASELKALLQLPDLERDLNWAAVCRLFTFLTTPLRESILAGVHKLPPGFALIAAPGRGPEEWRYWDVRFEPERARSESQTAEELRALLLESVRLRLVSDVPLGAFLSGGLDSSAVVAAMARQDAAPVKTFTIGFRDGAYDESAHAQRVAEALGTEHHELIVEPDAVEAIEEIVWHLDEPFGDPSAIPTYMVSRLAAEHVKVVLSGDGGDELFAGYDRYVVEAGRRALPFPSAARRPLRAVAAALPDGTRGRGYLHNLALPPRERYLDASTLFRRRDMRRLFTPAAWERMAGIDPWREASELLGLGGGDWLTAARFLDLESYLPLDVLTKVDRMSMAHSLEAREPLLDHKLVEFAAALPPEMLLRDGETKWIFKQALRGLVPEMVFDRPKHGFAVPIGRWFRGRLGGFVRDHLLSKRSRERGILDPRHVERLIDRHDRGRELDLQLFTMLGFELWCRQVLDRAAPTAAETSCA